jgi:hypothetical protein
MWPVRVLPLIFADNGRHRSALKSVFIGYLTASPTDFDLDRLGRYC